MPPPDNVVRSASAIFSSTESGQHVLKIEGYSRIRDAVASGSSVRSRPFLVGGYYWQISYFPNGYTPYWSEYISFQVVRDYCVDVRAQFTLCLLDQAGVPVPSYTSTVSNDFRNNRAVLFNYFILRSTLERSSEYLKNDCFTVRCDVTVTKPPEAKDVVAVTTSSIPTAPPPIVVAVPPSDLTRHLASLLATGEDSDVTFEVDGKMFKAHRNVLAARSPVFRALLKEEQSGDGDGGVVRIDDMEAQDFEALLGYMYTDSLPDMKVGEAAAVLPDLVAAANKYKMERLRLACENKLCEYVNVRTVAVMLAFAGEHHCHGLKNRCLQLLDDPVNLKAIVQTEGLEHLTKTYPLVLKDLIAKLAIKL
ncbi:hypothetical protein GUJ93_ZPchr0004g39133 [Zizania palustris]|uniref:Uncharacterized protein n=1 Tax=Zizania palustris TaxID=103762 RepID=A0A8J5SZ78_ZIZPA|nr:hypothetical protein GUJ93_ZPchr0004g39133 [Zizania palustris]